MTVDWTHNPDHEWMLTAACTQVDPDLWFPEKGHNDTSRAARRICHACPVDGPCLDYALDRDLRYGVWGGLTEADRRRITNQEGAS
jgi:WhiB family transcriptional regulator, redox-sensing transcriptional regulator